ncbi:MAG: hypothetical protein J6K20_02395 [Thermoguttaceae bacterium]|nr:hypothetical protein [Thermoguttaceae bacterium]
MKKLDVILSSAFLFAAATANVDAVAFAQGFGDYVAPAPTQTASPPAPSAPQTLPAASARTISTRQAAPASQSLPVAPSRQTPQTPQAPQTAQSTQLTPNGAASSAQRALPTADVPPAARSTRLAQTPPNASSAYSAPNVRSTPARPAEAQPVSVAQTPRPVATAPQTSAASPAKTNKTAKTGGSGAVANAFVPPPAHYKLSENDQLKLDEFLAHWENFGQGIKQVSCDVHMMEFDGGLLQQDSKKPVAHNWGLFRFKAPNQLLYHIKGEFSYANAESGSDAVWQEGKNELKIVLDGKSLTQYDYENKKAVVYPLAEDEQNLDLTMDNGQFPLFFVAKAETLKNRFYLRLVTPASKRQSEVWIEAFPRYARDAQQFQSIVVILGLKDMQPTYMRKVGVNGKSKTDLKFERVEVNKGRWTIEGTVDDDWTKEVRPERFSLLRQEAVETNYAQTSSAPAPNAAPLSPTPARTATRPDVKNVVR